YSGRRSELVERGLLFGIDLEDLIKPGDPENLQQIGMNAAKLELALDRGNFLLEVDQLAERGAGEILHVTEVQQDVLVTLILDQAVELLAHFLICSSVTILVSTKLTTVTPSTFSRRRRRRGPCDIGKLLSGTGTAPDPGNSCLYRPVPHAGLSGGVPESTEEPTEARTLRYHHTYQKVPRNQGSTEKRCSGKADAGRARADGSCSVLIESGLLLGMDLENLVEPCQLERHEQIWMDAAKLEFPLGGIDPSLQAHQFTQHGRGTVLDVTEVEQDLFLGAVFDKRVKLVADFLNLILGHDLGVGEAHHGYTVNVLNAEASARTLRHGKNSCSG